MKKLVKYIIAIVLGVGLVLLVTPVYAHEDTAYWHEEAATALPQMDWMSRLPDDRLLVDISMPGTHDTMAFSRHLFGGDITRTQTMSLEQQLQSGIRYLDIRVSYDNGIFYCYHGDVWLGYTFDDVLQTVQTYLQNHPSETILMRFKQEHSHVSDPEMWQLFTQYDERYPNLIWDRWKAATENPQLADVRGKVVILADVFNLPKGIVYKNLPKQDNYHLNTNWDLHHKWETIKAELERTNGQRNQQIRLNYLSGSGGSFPYFVASGHVTPSTYGSRLSTGLTEPAFRGYYPDFPRVARLGKLATIAFEGTNTLTADYLTEHAITRAGIVVADFPGQRLIEAVISCNFK